MGTSMPHRALLAGLLLGLAACGVSCDSDPPQEPCEPVVPSARIQGIVRTGGFFTRAQIRADQEDDPYNSYAATVDSSGAYTLDLPPGRYALRVRLNGDQYALSPEGAIVFRGSEEWLEVEAGDEPRRLDVRLGTLRVILNTPYELDHDVLGLRAELVRDEAGNPVNHGRGYEARAANGVATFDFVGLAPGTYQMLLFAGETAPERESFWLPGTRDQEAADTVTVLGDRLTIHGEALPEQSTWVSGQIEGSWQEFGLPGPNVQLHNLGGVEVSDQQLVDDTGAFRFRLFAPEPVRIEVQNGEVTRWIGGWTFDEATVFEPALGHPVEDIVEREGGLFLDLPFEGERFYVAVIDLMDPATLQVMGSWAFDQFPSGIYPFANLLPGRYLLRIAPRAAFEASWLGQWFDGADSAEGARVVEIPEEGVLPLTIRLVEGGSIEGRVSFVYEETGAFRMSLTTAERLQNLGDPPMDYEISSVYRYRARGLAEGRYKVGVQMRDWEEPWPVFPDGVLWYPGTASWDSAAVLVVEPQGRITGVDFSLSP
jgi:hypothetical protein